MTVMERRMVVVVATPTSPLLPELLHALSHCPNLSVTVLTRETSISIPVPSEGGGGGTHVHNHAHAHDPPTTTSRIQHVQTTFVEPELASLLTGAETVICTLTGADLHLSPVLITAARQAGVKRFIPSEYGLDTGNARIRALLPPSQRRFEIQARLEGSGMAWTAIYAGVALEEGMQADGVLGIDVLWASVVVFPHGGGGGRKVVVSSYGDVARAIVGVVVGEPGEGGGGAIYAAGFQATLDEVVGVVEKELDRDVDRYEGSLEGARKEALERMKMGYFDGGVSLMGRVAIWDPDVDAWGAWKDGVEVGRGKGDWEEEVRKVVRVVRGGQASGGGDCGC